MFEELIEKMEANTQFLIDDEIYLADDGLYHCKTCGGARQTKVEINGEIKTMPCICSCLEQKFKERDAKIKQDEINRAKEKKLKDLRKASLIGDRYSNVRFNNTETSHNAEFKHIYDRCLKYCKVAKKVLEKGYGIYLWGDKGTGKSRLTTCMANELLDNYYSVVFTNFSEISKIIRDTYNYNNDSEYKFIEKLTSVDFLFIDDFGTELVTKGNQDAWLQEKVYDVVNKRYNNQLPIIFTSNYSLKDLVEKRGMAGKTVDRIVEMCEPMKLQGSSYRMKNAKQREKLF